MAPPSRPMSAYSGREVRGLRTTWDRYARWAEPSPRTGGALARPFESATPATPAGAPCCPRICQPVRVAAVMVTQLVTQATGNCQDLQIKIFQAALAVTSRAATGDALFAAGG